MLEKVEKTLILNGVCYPQMKDREVVKKLMSDGWELESDPRDLGYGEDGYKAPAKDVFFGLSQKEYEDYIKEDYRILTKTVDAFICTVPIAETADEDFDAIREKMLEGFMLTAYDEKYLLFKPAFLRSKEETKEMLEKVTLEIYNYDMSKYTTFEYLDNFVKSLTDVPTFPEEDFNDLKDVVAALVDLPSLLFGRTSVWMVEKKNVVTLSRFGFVLKDGKYGVVSYTDVPKSETVYGEYGPI